MTGKGSSRDSAVEEIGKRGVHTKTMANLLEGDWTYTQKENVCWDRILVLRAAIADGSYDISSAQTAESLLQNLFGSQAGRRS